MRSWNNDELVRIEKMVLAWKEHYLLQAGPEDGWEFLCDDFRDEIQTHVYPYLRRMCESKLLAWDEMRVFLEYCDFLVEDLRLKIKERSHAGKV
ncbi:MAG TPA: hypothetical protein ENG14_03770 [Thermodesulforhabdus norvegica]|uniref:Uncharacterized protein n=1 Tax=Thermodesulforhabdus norvegica TaxID=39841 RepID=A0A7C1AYE5_9BACT|nr:hypothetical protein [Deltaproteobacteria bacterium]MBW2068874.1 hypothetical protein [Deltaproteobacteria bacterium]HDL90002.1 hypothetical protein [Thermodesulforhabdus norvegica]